MNLESNIANHFNVAPSSLSFDEFDFGATSLTVRVNGVPFDVFFNHKAEVTFSCPV